MKKLKALGLLILSTVALAGCTTANPNYNPAQPPSVTNPAYVPDTNKLAQVFTPIQAAATATAPVDPYAGLVDLGIKGGLLLATLISGVIASSQTKKASAQAAATAHLATVLPDNMVDKAVNTAPNAAVASTVAAALNAAPDTGVVAVKAS